MGWNFRQRENLRNYFSYYSKPISSSFLSTVTTVPLLRFQRRFSDRFLRALLCRAHICLERVAFRRGNTFISILRQAEADVACAAVANECVRAASKNGSRKKPPLKAYKVRSGFPRLKFREISKVRLNAKTIEPITFRPLSVFFIKR